MSDVPQTKEDVKDYYRIFTNGNKLPIIVSLLKKLGKGSVLSDDKRNNCYVVRCTKEEAEDIVTTFTSWALSYTKYDGDLYKVSF